MAEPLHFDLVSPERLLVSEEVESVVVPGAEGYFTVLARHAPFMSTLKPGLVEVKELSGGTQKIFVRGGFADVTPKRAHDPGRPGDAARGFRRRGARAGDPRRRGGRCRRRHDDQGKRATAGEEAAASCATCSAG